MSLLAIGVIIGMFVGAPLGVLVMCCLFSGSHPEGIGAAADG